MKTFKYLAFFGFIIAMFFLVPRLKGFYFSLPSCEQSGYANQISLLAFLIIFVLYIPLLILRITRRLRPNATAKLFETIGDRMTRHPAWFVFEGILFSFLLSLPSVYLLNLSQATEFQEEAKITKKEISASTGKGGPALWRYIYFYSGMVSREIGIEVPAEQFIATSVGETRKMRLRKGRLSLVCGF